MIGDGREEYRCSRDVSKPPTDMCDTRPRLEGVTSLACAHISTRKVRVPKRRRRVAVEHHDVQKEIKERERVIWKENRLMDLATLAVLKRY